ncbi:MAG: PepSY domain-containing protein [Planctomycetia bacterium]|nr:PepSY domain-containing protein [Planctomycetia bacterium]
MRRRDAFVLHLSLLAAAGCAGEPQSDEIVPVDKVPAAIMATARKELPGYTFDTVYKIRVGGKDAYEVRGKDKRGKVREVEISTTGEVLAIE